MRQRFSYTAIFSILIGLVLLVACYLGMQHTYTRFIYAPQNVPAEQVAVVFGAGLNRNGGLSTILRDRMDVAIALYKAGKVTKLLVSGDNRFANYDEPGAMLAYAVEHGVDASDIQPDYGGRRTYDSCYRVRHIFQLERAILVTQRFHLVRALFLYRQLGVDALGVAADLRPYRDSPRLAIREVGARLISVWDALLQSPPPVMGTPILID